MNYVKNTTHSHHCHKIQHTQIEYTFKDTLHNRSVYKIYADLSLVISALNRLDRRSIPRIIVKKMLNYW